MADSPRSEETTEQPRSPKEWVAEKLGHCEETGRDHIADDLNPNVMDDEAGYHCFYCGERLEEQHAQ
jgi:hypothetical protein